nr:C6 transcription factor [Colletotrichum truncatum]KAF6797200.1 C6 transcription factor [Colletotrichum truncatum]
MPESCSPTSPGKNPSLALRFVDSAHSEPKKKKTHKKSRGGCVACKKRKVKCDERLPCANCLRRNETCQPSQKPSSSEKETSPVHERPLDLTGPVNLLHMELFHHFQHTTVPTLCFDEVWGPAICLAFKEEYLMTAMLAISARHLSILRPKEPAYAQAAMVLLSRSCAVFSAALDREDGGEKHNTLFFTAMLIHYLTWCNLEFLEDQRAPVGDSRLDLKGDQLFLLSSGVRVFLSGTRAHGSESIFANMSSISQCSALDTIVETQGMDCDSIIEEFMQLYDEIAATASDPNTTNQSGSPDRIDLERDAYRGIVTRLSVILALLKHKDSNNSPPQRSDLERYIFSFPLFCFGIFLDLITSGDSRAFLVLYHFYRTSRLLLGTEGSWWASERLETMEGLIEAELKARGVPTSVTQVGGLKLAWQTA